MQLKNLIGVVSVPLVDHYSLLYVGIPTMYMIANEKLSIYIIAYVGCTPVVWILRHDGSIALSTYATEFMALRTVIEDDISDICLDVLYFILLMMD